MNSWKLKPTNKTVDMFYNDDGAEQTRSWKYDGFEGEGDVNERTYAEGKEIEYL